MTLIDEIEQLFAGRLLIGHAEAARALGFDPKSLTREGDRGAVRYRLRGKRRCYAREDLAEYLKPQTPLPAPQVRTSRISSTGAPMPR
jgi:hypothetical protein